MLFYATLVIYIVSLLSVNAAQPDALLIEEEIDNISDASDDILPQYEEYRNYEHDYIKSTSSATLGNAQVPPLFVDPKVYGMNIGLHFILEDINRRLATGKRVHLESLIKVLVLTHNMEKVGGTVNESNKVALKNAIGLYPAALREALVL